jgi:hypothetical protein
MRSPRSALELSCRLGAFALLGWLLGMALTPRAGRRTERASAHSLADALPVWTRLGSRVALHADLNVVPERWSIDWLAALARAGRPVSWSGTPPVVGISAEPIVDPAGGARLDVAAPGGTVVVLNDDVSTIDSVRTGTSGMSVATPMLAGSAIAIAAGQRFGAAPIDSLVLGAVIVVGRAGWEGKFVAAALEERGWRVTGRWSIAPGVNVSQGMIDLDTSRVSAIVALDTTAASLAGAIERFVRNGGGLVLAGSAAAAPAFAALAPAAIGERIVQRATTSDTVDRGATGFYALSSLRADATPLERRQNRVAVAARRVGAGRVIQLGFDESWRWRMAGAPGSEAAHRAWWTNIVGSVAYSSHPERSEGSAVRDRSTMSAPLATLVDRLGAARPSPPANFERWTPDSRLLLALMLALLLIEWTSRRLRGAR